MTSSESKGRFLQKESNRIDSHNESNRFDSNRELECSTSDCTGSATARFAFTHSRIKRSLRRAPYTMGTIF